MMAPEWPYATPFDWAWLTFGVVACLFAGLNCWRAVREYRAAIAIDLATLRNPRATVSERLEGRWLRHVGAQEVRVSLLTAGQAGLVAFTGLCALYLPLPAPDVLLAPLSFAAGVAMMAIAVLIMLHTVSEYIARRCKPGGTAC
jgi:hypothetical protein